MCCKRGGEGGREREPAVSQKKRSCVEGSVLPPKYVALVSKADKVVQTPSHSGFFIACPHGPLGDLKNSQKEAKVGRAGLRVIPGLGHLDRIGGRGSGHSSPQWEEEPALTPGRSSQKWNAQSWPSPLVQGEPLQMAGSPARANSVCQRPSESPHSWRGGLPRHPGAPKNKSKVSPLQPLRSCPSSSGFFLCPSVSHLTGTGMTLLVPVIDEATSTPT